MSQSLIKQRIESALKDSKVSFLGEACQLRAVVVSQSFEGLSRVARQQLVYKSLGDAFESGEVHALSFKTYTHDEYQNEFQN